MNGHISKTVTVGESAGPYYNVLLPEMERVLGGMGFARVNLAGTHEVVFSKMIEFEGLKTVVRIYTAILKSTGESRPAGKDAIRVCLGRWDPERPDEVTGRKGSTRLFKTLEVVRRTREWESNLRARIASIPSLDRATMGRSVEVATARQVELSEEDVVAGASAKVVVQREKIELGDIPRPKCPRCGSDTTHAKAGARGLFYGCSRYPTCKGLVDAAEHAVEFMKRKSKE